MRLFTEIKPNKANLYFNILPMLTISLLLISMTLFQSVVIMITFITSMVIYFYFAMIWRFVMGKLTYDLTPQDMRSKISYGFFIFFSIFNFLIIPILVVFIFILRDGIVYVLGFIVFMLFYGFFSNYFQFKFISRNLSIIKFGKDFKKNKKPLSWMTLAYFPLTAIKTQTEINDIFKDKK